jgi:hypothetical protein
MVPFQLDIRRSSPSFRPYEHASETQTSDSFVIRGRAWDFTCTVPFLALLELF